MLLLLCVAVCSGSRGNEQCAACISSSCGDTTAAVWLLTAVAIVTDSCCYTVAAAVRCAEMIPLLQLLSVTLPVGAVSTSTASTMCCCELSWCSCSGTLLLFVWRCKQQQRREQCAVCSSCGVLLLSQCFGGCSSSSGN
jgi:hypothetical protein